MVVIKQCLAERNSKTDYLDVKTYSLTRETACSSPQKYDSFQLKLRT